MRREYFLIILLAFACVMFCNIHRAEAATFTVSNSDDSGAGSLRQAITDSNAAGGTNTIDFTAAVADTITLLSPLPTIGGSTTYINTSGATGAVAIEGNTMDFNCTYLKLRGGDAMTIGAGVDMSGTTTIAMGFEVDATTLDVTDGATLGCSTIYVGGDWDDGGAAIVTIENGSTFTNTNYAYIGYYYGATGEVIVDGVGSSWVNTSANDGSIGRWGNGTLTIINGGTVTTAGAWVMGWKSVGVGVVYVSGEGSKYITSNRNLYGGSVGVGTITVSDGGEIDLGTIGEVRLAWSAGSTGTLNIGEGAAAGTITAPAVRGNVGGGTATVNFNHNEAAYDFAPNIQGPIIVNHIGTGTTTFTGTNTYTGLTTINAGTLTAGSTSAFGTGAVTNNATLDLDTTALSGIGVYRGRSTHCYPLG